MDNINQISMDISIEDIFKGFVDIMDILMDIMANTLRVFNMVI